MHYVYIIQSIQFPDQIYVGLTHNPKERLSNHNYGCSAHTSKYMPWKMIVSLEFEDKSKAMEFEKYLKTGSGRGFMASRFL